MGRPMMSFLFSAQGRISRKAIWLFFFASIGASIVAAILDVVILNVPLESADSGPISALLSILLIWPTIVVNVKRFHDRGMSGWWVLWFILIILAAMIPGGALLAMQGENVLGFVLIALGAAIPIIWQFIILYVQPGEKGPNQFGPNPLDPVGGDIAEAFD